MIKNLSVYIQKAHDNDSQYQPDASSLYQLMWSNKICVFWFNYGRKIWNEIKGKKVKCSRYRPGVAQRVGRGIALLFHDRDTRRWWVVNSTPRTHFTPGKDPVPILQEAGWVPGPVWTGAENLVPTGIRSRTVQPVVSPYTEWATGPTYRMRYILQILSKMAWIQ